MPGNLPSCFMSCFGFGREAPENESSHFADAKSPGLSSGVCSGVLSSFLSKRSCSRGTWDISASGTGKARNADCVTLATAKYLELFTTGAKNDDTSTVLSDVRGAQDSIRTGSEYPVSRSSTFTAIGRASREPSRLGGQYHSQMQQQASAGSPGANVPLSQRRSVSSTRRSGQHYSVAEVSPQHTPNTSEPSQLPTPPLQPNWRKANAAMAAHGLSPFTSKMRMLNSGARSRSDRLSPSAAACLLPAPSIRNIARAQTALPTTGSAETLSPSVSMSDLHAGASDSLLQHGAGVEGSGVNVAACSATSATTAAITPNPFNNSTNNSGSSGAPPKRRGLPVRSSTGYVVPSPLAPGDGKQPAHALRRSRLNTESGGPSTSTACPSSPPHGSSLADPETSAGPQRTSYTRSATLVHTSCSSSARTGGGKPLPYRRPSILFGRDGDVTVTGLPPSCLTAGRAPRCMKHSSGGFTSGALLGSTSIADPSADPYAALMTTVATSSSSAAHGGAYSRRSVDGRISTAGTGTDPRGPPGPSEVIPAVFLASRSHDSSSRCANSMDLVLTLNNGTEVGRRGDLPMIASTETTERMCRAEPQFQTLNSTIMSTGRNVVMPPTDGQVGQQSPVPEDEALGGDEAESKAAVATHALATAGSSCDGQRCEWGGASSLFTRSRFSNSSRLTNGGTNAVMAGVSTPYGSVVSHHDLDKLSPGAIGSTAVPAPKVPSVPAVASAVPMNLNPHATTHLHHPHQHHATQQQQQQQQQHFHVHREKRVSAGVRLEEDTCRSSQMWLCGGGTEAGQSGNFGGFQASTANSLIFPPSTTTPPQHLVTEARDVTSALTRLQEACMAAVAQGELRSQRLCKRLIIDMPRAQCPLQSCAEGVRNAEGIVFGPAAGSDMLVRSPEDDGTTPAGARGRPRGIVCSKSMSVIVARTPGAQATSPPRLRRVAGLPELPEGAGSSSGAAEASSLRPVAPSGEIEMLVETSALDEESQPGPGMAPTFGEHVAFDEAYGEGAANHSQRDAGAGGGGAAGGGDGGNPEEEEEYRKRLLNRLLRGDFLHETVDVYNAGSDEDDEGVVEYRYGGFELGGGDGHCSFSRQASFMEAVRKCNVSQPGRT